RDCRSARFWSKFEWLESSSAKIHETSIPDPGKQIDFKCKCKTVFGLTVCPPFIQSEKMNVFAVVQ
ncbi:MAG TPA: hypothetical protein DD473_07070, partial [Planctomycetaceae bacterium]|nr:hypothetical protein [Planctomycetaceae bacterium]